MHILLKFSSHRNCHLMGTQGDKLSALLVLRSCTGNCVRGAKISSEVVDSALTRKAIRLWIRCPYRKPTQVGEERILRPAGEVLLRNSAKLPRNFGIRGAHESEPQRIGPSDCLPKTQVYAKS